MYALSIEKTYHRDVVQMARTFALGAKGRQFKSAHPDMKKLLFLGCCILLIVFGISFYKNTAVSLNTVSYDLNGKTYHLLTAKNSAQWEKGLMYFRNLKDADGMIFIFPDKQFRSFWNKNTYMNLDVYWINGKTVVGKNFLPSEEKRKTITVINSPDKVDRVIELIAGK